MNIPPRAVGLLEHLWKRGATPELAGAREIASVAIAKRLIRLDWGNERLQLRFGGISLVAQLLQGTFPNYGQLIPTETAPPITVHAEDMERALRQVRKVAEDGSGIVRLVWEGEKLTVSAQGKEVGQTSVPIPVTSSAPGRTALNLGYLLEYFKGRSGVVTMAPSGGEAGPVLFSHRGAPHILIMPMHVQW
jgi:DNA polymerase-3 subunit beta